MLHVTALPAFTDNYIWVLHAPDSREIAIVDPGDSRPVREYIEQHNLTLRAVLITHSHFDHIGGVADLIAQHPAPVYGPRSPNIPNVTNTLEDNDTFRIWDTDIEVLHTPGHLPEHICFVLRRLEHTQVFVGDTLFASGCGRIFDGEPAQLKGSLDRLSMLPPDSRVYAAHEYTLTNIRFAKTVEPDNTALLDREQEVNLLRQHNEPSLPTTLGWERETNPFLRCDIAQVAANVSDHAGKDLTSELEVFTALRQWKDNF